MEKNINQYRYRFEGFGRQIHRPLSCNKLEWEQESGFVEFTAGLEKSRKNLHPELSLSVKLKDEV